MDDFSGLLFSCPMGKEVEGCPFSKVRKIKDIEERLEVFWKIPARQRMEMQEYHRNCMSNRLKNGK